jgi:methionyl aminopeptidase
VTNSFSNKANTLQSTHKAIHKSQSNFLSNFIIPKVVSEPDPDTGLYNPFPTFPFTGSLRPVYPLSERREVPKSIKHPDYWRDGIPHSERTFGGRNKIEILDKAGQEGMRKVCRLAREVLDIAAAEVRPGITTDYLDEIVHKACLERDVRFPKAVNILGC